MKHSLVIVGTGQIADEVRDFVECNNLYKVIGYALDKKWHIYHTYNGLSIYPLEDLENYVDREEVGIFIAVSWFHYLNRERKRIYCELKNKGFYFPNLISPRAVLFKTDIGEGNWFHDYAYAGYGTKIGNNCIIRPFTYIGHHCIINDHTFLGVRSTVGGNSIVGERCFVGMAAVIFNDVSIGKKCIIGGGAVAKRNLPDFSQCKLSNDSMMIKTYGETEIDTKLMSRVHENKNITK